MTRCDDNIGYGVGFTEYRRPDPRAVKFDRFCRSTAPYITTALKLSISYFMQNSIDVINNNGKEFDLSCRELTTMELLSEHVAVGVYVLTLYLLARES